MGIGESQLQAGCAAEDRIVRRITFVVILSRHYLHSNPDRSHSDNILNQHIDQKCTPLALSYHLLVVKCKRRKGREATEETDLKLACFSCAPAIRAPLWNLLSEIIGTAVLLWVTTAMGSKGVGGLSPGMAPPIVGAVVWSIGLSLGGPTGYAINPARDLGPRIAHALLPISGKGDSDWGYAWIPVVAPVLGGICGAIAYRALLGG